MKHISPDDNFDCTYNPKDLFNVDFSKPILGFKNKYHSVEEGCLF